jgi:hypothetical protein
MPYFFEIIKYRRKQIMQKIYKKYQGVAIEDDLAYVSKEFKQFASYFN